MFSHIMVGTNDLERSAGSTTPSSAHWASRRAISTSIASSGGPGPGSSLRRFRLMASRPPQPMAARSALPAVLPSRSTPGTRRAWRTVAQRSRIHPGCARDPRENSISPTCAIPMATRSAHFFGCRPDVAQPGRLCPRGTGLARGLQPSRVHRFGAARGVACLTARGAARGAARVAARGAARGVQASWAYCFSFAAAL